MSTSDIKYTSNEVMEECFGLGDNETGKANTMLRNLRRQVRKFRTCLNQSDCEPDPEQFSLIANHVRVFKEQGKNKNEMSDCIGTLLESVQIEFYQSKSMLDKLNRHKRKEPYKELYKQLESEISHSNSDVELDRDDLEIILDAHDLAITVERLILVTGDLKHIVAAGDIILQNTKIYDVQYLKKYTPS